MTAGSLIQWTLSSSPNCRKWFIFNKTFLISATTSSLIQFLSLETFCPAGPAMLCFYELMAEFFQSPRVPRRARKRQADHTTLAHRFCPGNPPTARNGCRTSN
jgi:hypothetical protein